MQSYHSSAIYYINSSDRLSGTNGHFTYSIPLPSDNDFDRVCLLQANIPISFYMVPIGNSFVLTEAGTNVTITVPIGNYNVNSFRSVLTSLLNTHSPHGWVYTVAYPSSSTTSNTAKYTYTVSTGNPSFTFGNDHLSELFGFNDNTTVSFTSSTLVSVNVLKFVNADSIFIRSDLVDDGNEGILQEIFNNNSQALSNAVFQCSDVQGFSKRMRSNRNTVYTFSITDADGHDLDLNGLPCHLSILFFKRDDVAELLKKFLKLTVLQQE